MKLMKLISGKHPKVGEGVIWKRASSASSASLGPCLAIEDGPTATCNAPLICGCSLFGSQMTKTPRCASERKSAQEFAARFVVDTFSYMSDAGHSTDLQSIGIGEFTR
jgi:hypothetical protein